MSHAHTRAPRSTATLTSLALAALASLAPCAHAQLYAISAPAGSGGAMALAGSQDGSVITGYYGFFGGPNGAFRWTPAGGLITIPKVSTPNYTVANGVSRNGLIIGGSSNDLGFRWTSGTGSTAIGPFGTGSPTEVYGLSGDGNTFFGRTRQLSGAMRAFTWTTGGGLNLLPQVPGSYNSQVNASNNTGSTLVGTCDIGGITKAVVWNGAGATNIAGAWPGIAFPEAVNDAGTIIWGEGDFAPGVRHAVRWRLVGSSWVADDMGIPAPYNQITVGGCSVDGKVHVGGLYDSVGGGFPGYMWSTTLGWKIIGPWLQSLGYNTAGYQFIGTDGVSADGTAMWGSANLAGNRVGWVARNIPCLQQPQIYNDPADQFGVCVGGEAGFGVSAAPENYLGTLSYQWQRNGININNGPTGTGATYSGTNTPNLLISGVQPGDNAFYSCIISNPCGSVSSASGELQVTPLPYFTFLPAPAWVCNISGSASFTVGAQNATYYQWEWQSPTNGQWYPFVNGYNADVTPGFGMAASGVGTPTLTISNVSFNYHTQVNIRIGSGNACRSLRPQQTTLYRREAPTWISGANNVYYCHNTPSVFSANLSDVQQWYWLFWDPTFNTWLYLNDGYFIDSYTNLSANVSGAYTPTLTFDIQTLGTVPNNLYFVAMAVNDCGTSYSFVGTLNICRADFNCDGFVDFTDFDDFGGAFELGGLGSDFNGDGFIDFTDFDSYVAAFELGC
ncbi:MAG: hypothetical protein SFY96_10010 [Planctomycetota bacterium]|nr:hypothetical protein [Planctomycetota bacterium]